MRNFTTYLALRGIQSLTPEASPWGCWGVPHTPDIFSKNGRHLSSLDITQAGVCQWVFRNCGVGGSVADGVVGENKLPFLGRSRVILSIDLILHKIRKSYYMWYLWKLICLVNSEFASKKFSTPSSRRVLVTPLVDTGAFIQFSLIQTITMRFTATRTTASKL